MHNYPMEIRQYEIFRILAHELSFTRAAERAHCVQSNVTVQVRSMEEELGVPLFERMGRHVRLTAHGARLLPYAEKILHLIGEAAAVTVGRDSPAGTLVIGSPESVLTYRVPRVAQNFRTRYPEVELVFRACSTSELHPQLEQGRLDFGLVIDDGVDDPHLHVESLCPERLTLLASPGHELASRAAVRATDLRGHTLLLTDRGCAYRNKLESALGRAAVKPKLIMEFSNVETIKQCAILGMGVACLPAMVAKTEISQGKLAALAWKGPSLSMQTLLVWHKDKWISPAMQAFFGMLRAQLNS
jgi:DNA-binding transcriptional LysR family regulator